MEKHSYPLKAVEYLNLEPKTISNWDARRLFYLPIEKPGPGLPRTYSRENLIEMAVAVEMLSSGFTREQVLQAFRSRARNRRRSGLTGVGYETSPSDLFQNAPELQEGHNGHSWLLHTDGNPNVERATANVIACTPFEDKDVAEVFTHYRDKTFTVLPISHVVQQLDEALAKWDSKDTEK